MIAYDKNDQQLQSFQNKKGIHCTDDLAALIASCDYIFGCSGRDISEGRRLSSKNKTLISCSSEDKEFLSLLQMVNPKNPFFLILSMTLNIKKNLVQPSICYVVDFH